MSEIKREWMPEKYADEVCPPPRPHPNDWIVRLPGDGVFALADGLDTEAEPELLTDGKRVKFDWYEDHGTAEFTLNADGTYSVDRQPPDADTPMNISGDPDTLAFGLEDFAEVNGAQIKGDGAGPWTETINYYRWSPEAVTFEFRGGAFDEIVRGPAFTTLANAVSDAIHVALDQGMKSDEAACVVAQVAADYARIEYGNGYLNDLAEVVRGRSAWPMPAVVAK